MRHPRRTFTDRTPVSPRNGGDLSRIGDPALRRIAHRVGDAVQPSLRTALCAIAMTVLAACNDDIVGPEGHIPTAAAADVAITSAEHDDFDGAVLITQIPFTDSSNTSEALTAPDDPFCSGQGPTVWYTFTAPADGLYEANTFGSDYDTTLGAYTGTRGNLTELACNDDTFGLQSQLVIPLAAGQTVYFMVGAYNSGPGGNLAFNLNLWTPPPPPPPLTVELTLASVGTIDPVTGVAVVRGTATCSLWSYVSVFGVLRQRIGRSIVEAYFWSFAECNGSTPWEAQVIAQNALLVAGQAEVRVEAYFFDAVYGQSAYAQQNGTVRLRGGTGRVSTSASLNRANFPTDSVRSLEDVIRADSRLTKGRKDP